MRTRFEMLKTKSLTLAIISVLIAMIACDNSESIGNNDMASYESEAVSGLWIGRAEISDERLAEQGDITSEQREQILNAIESMEFRLDLRDDYTYTMTMKPWPTTDTWKWDDGDIVLASTSSSYNSTTNPSTGEKTKEYTPDKSPVRLVRSSDGESLRAERFGDSENAYPVTFHRE